MGCISSINRKPTQSTSDPEFNPDLTSYQNACRSDPTLHSFDSTLQTRTNRVITTLALDPTLSLHSLRVVIETLLDNDRDVLQLILKYETDIWNHNGSFSLVKEYLETSLQTLDFCKSFEDCLKNARSSISFLQTAIDQYDEDGNDHSNTLEQFKKFKSFENPFPDEFLRSFRSVYGKQVSLLNKLRAQTGEVFKKLESIKGWRMVSNVIFVTTFSTVLICSVVAASAAVPPLVTAMAAAATLVPLGSIGKWVDSLWKEYEKELKYQKNTMNVMMIQSDVFVIKDLDNIKVIVDRMGIKMNGLLEPVKFVIKDEVNEAIGVAVDEIKNPVIEFARMVDDLSDESVKCISDIKRATILILGRIKEHPRMSDSP